MIEQNDCKVPKESKAAAVSKEEILTLDEVVALTGYKKSYIYKLVHLRKIPAGKTPFGRKLFFSKAAIEQWALATKLLTVNEIN